MDAEELTCGPGPYSIKELTKMHNLSRQAVTRLYEDQPDILICPSRVPHCYGKRRYRTIRVPRHVYNRVQHSMEQRNQ